VVQLRASQALEGLKGDNSDEQVGIGIIRESLEEPARWLAKNSGADAGWAVRKVLENKQVNYGFDALNMDFGDMLSKGIMDPVKVTRSALQNAASVASMILTTECLITDLPEKEEKGGGHGAGAGMPDMGM
jgi:chaperonin GroEL